MAAASRTPWGWVVAGGLALFMAGRCSAGMDAQQPGAVTASAVAASQQFREAVHPVTHAYVQPRTLNCRTAPSTDGGIHKRLGRNERVGVAETSAGWSRLEPEDCWVKSSLLSDGPAPQPEYRPAPRERRVQSFAATSSETYYANCSAARAAGAAPVRIGEPGYSRRLDRDGDGVGCE